MTNSSSYNSTTQHSVFGVEYEPYTSISWINEGTHAWTLHEAALAADPATLVSQRVITGEPMSIIMNLGQSTGFTTVNYTALTYPATMRIDYVRVYQKAGTEDGLTCDPPNFPTADYINTHMEAYTNVNYTLWSDYTNVSGFRDERGNGWASSSAADITWGNPPASPPPSSSQASKPLNSLADTCS